MDALLPLLVRPRWFQEPKQNAERSMVSLSKATFWGDITWRCLCSIHVSCFSPKCVKAAAVPKGLWCKLASAHGLPAMMAFIHCGNKPCCQSMWINVQGFIGNSLLQRYFSSLYALTSCDRKLDLSTCFPYTYYIHEVIGTGGTGIQCIELIHCCFMSLLQLV